jgi:hypothetical protein
MREYILSTEWLHGKLPKKHPQIEQQPHNNNLYILIRLVHLEYISTTQHVSFLPPMSSDIIIIE